MTAKPRGRPPAGNSRGPAEAATAESPEVKINDVIRFRYTSASVLPSAGRPKSAVWHYAVTLSFFKLNHTMRENGAPQFGLPRVIS